jgi:hypothetical protein
MPGAPAIANRSTFPAGRIALTCGANALLSAASVATGLAIKAMLITATIAAFVLMMRSDRRAASPLLPSDAFSIRSGTGAGLWMILLMSVGYSPLAIYAPLFLRASLRIPLVLVAAPLAAGAIGVRLNLMVPRSPEQGLTAARSG